ncbi:biopolymer transporter ExbD [Aquincola sp. S2]|uniref:Biopolymer transporter ExbD n=1 Tax=Pseudaquabacterium terrae TaxID=2732868 RepID=A0ABX2EPM2_9BURK|nr:biopolymer transporter ExbD [Aquabacterium terrae]NRF70652.1 biopolymer transporter ExbD [Aquabacterium terrae]
MPAVASRGSHRRRAVSEINMVPFIDVMLVLLIIFMVSAPLIPSGLVELPSVGKAAQKPDKVIEVIVGTDERIRLRVDGGEPTPTTMKQLGEKVKQLQAGNAQVPVVISADKNVKYEQVVQAMDRLQKSQIARVGLAVRQGN